LVQSNETGIGDHRIRGVGLKETFDGSGGFVNVPVAKFDEVFLSPPLLFGGYPKLSTGDAGGLVNRTHQGSSPGKIVARGGRERGSVGR
jgi:hypothetical protein